MDINFLTEATVHDSLSDHNGSNFSTWNRKHYNWMSCPGQVRESWWFPENCSIVSNLNGIYGWKEDAIYGGKEGAKIHWGKFDRKDPTRAPITSEMKIRPANFKRR